MPPPFFISNQNTDNNMACSATISGLLRDCDANTGGLKAIYIANQDDVSAMTLDSGSNQIETLTMATGKTFKGFYFKRGQANFSLTPQFTDAGEYAGEQGKIAINFGRMDSTKRAQLSALSVIEMAVICLDNNGNYWYFGKDHAVLRTGGEAATGAANTDRNQYGFELTSNDHQYPMTMAAAAVNSALGNA